MNDKQHYFNLEKGFEGEVKFDTFMEELSEKCYIFNDLQLEINNSTVQIDSLIITQMQIIPIEVKNYEGNYLYQNENFYKSDSNKPIPNPLHQLNRSEIMLRQFLQQHKFNFLVNGYVIFVNSEFFLYQAPQDKPIVFLPQINSFLKTLNEKPNKLNSNHKKLAELFIMKNIKESRFTRLPSHDNNQLKKGVK